MTRGEILTKAFSTLRDVAIGDKPREALNDLNWGIFGIVAMVTDNFDELPCVATLFDKRPCAEAGELNCVTCSDKAGVGYA